MRNIFHEILARYLTDDQHAFDASPRELWPSERFEFQLANRARRRRARRGFHETSGGPQ